MPNSQVKQPEQTEECRYMESCLFTLEFIKTEMIQMRRELSDIRKNHEDIITFIKDTQNRFERIESRQDEMDEDIVSLKSSVGNLTRIIESIQNRWSGAQLVLVTTVSILSAIMLSIGVYSHFAG